MCPARWMTLLVFLSLAGTGLSGCGNENGGEPLPPIPPATDLTLQLVTANLTFPVFMTAAPGDGNRLFIVEKSGRIRIFNLAASSLMTFLDISGLLSTVGERGLLGMAFDPSYSTNGRFYVLYTDISGAITIAQFLVSANPNQANGLPQTILLSIPHPNSNHNGGMLALGPDGCLYAGIGDGGGANDPNNNGQNVNTRLGKLLRINPVNGAPCANNTPNPFVAGAAPEVWSFGLRNPWRFSFDRVTNDLYIGDVGQDAREEINVSLAPNAGRQSNYGWRFMEGFLCFNPATNCNLGGLTLPVLDYPHAGGACSVTGGYVYRGAANPALRGAYFFADFCAGFVRSFRFQNGQVTNQLEWPLLSPPGGSITSFGEDAQGELYLMIRGGSLFRIVAN